MEELLKKLKACQPAKEWAEKKDWNEIYETCPRGDWFLWLFKRTNPNDLKLLTLAKAHCANTVRHLMTDERSLKAVDVAIAFGEGKATRDELDAAYTDADAAYADAAAAAYAYANAAAAAYAYAADANANAAAAAAAYADADAAAAAAADAADADAAYAYADAAAAAAYAAKKENQLLTADICRKYLPIQLWNIN